MPDPTSHSDMAIIMDMKVSAICCPERCHHHTCAQMPRGCIVSENPVADTHRLVSVLSESASLYEELEAFTEAAEQRYLAAIAADAANDTTLRDTSAAAFLRLTAAAESAVASAV